MLPITRVWTLLEFPVNQNHKISNSGLFGKKYNKWTLFKKNWSPYFDMCNNQICASAKLRMILRSKMMVMTATQISNI